MPGHRPLVAVLLLCGPLALISAQEQPPPSAPPRIASGVTAIVVDVLVRDNKGNPVTDLRNQDFRLFEDGEPQEIQDVTVIAGTPQPAVATAAATRVPSGIAPSFTAIVFSRLSPEARGRAYDGRIIAQAPMTLPAADASGPVEHIAQLPLAALSPGRYTLRVTVTDGQSEEVRETGFELID